MCMRVLQAREGAGNQREKETEGKSQGFGF